MKIVHIADTHLGLSGFDRIDPESGMNLREKLFYDNFLESVEAIIRQKPDAVVHAGDLFDRVRPKTNAYITVLSALDMLADAGIPVVMIAGNHSMPKTRYTPSPFRVLDYHRAEVHCAYGYRYERCEIGDTIFHLIPNMLRASDYRSAFDEIGIERRSCNVMITHGLSTTLRDYRLRTVAEHEIDSTMLSEDFDYIALGHFHGQKQVAENAWYSGSIEYCSYGEIDDEKGGLIVDTETGKPVHLDLPHIPMTNLGAIDCADKNPVEITDSMAAVVGRLKDPERLICRIMLKNILPETVKGLGREEMAAIKGSVLNLRIVTETADPVKREFEAEDPGAVDYVDEFSRFVKTQGLSGDLEAEIVRTGTGIFRKVMERHMEDER